MPDETILIVDDEKNVRTTLSHALEDLGRPLASAVNGEDALRRLRELDVAVMLLDLRMPGIDGLEVLRRVAREWPEVRVVVITAYGAVPDVVEAMKLGAVDFLEKPFSPEEVRTVVRRILGPGAVGGGRAPASDSREEA